MNIVRALRVPLLYRARLPGAVRTFTTDVAKNSGTVKVRGRPREDRTLKLSDLNNEQIDLDSLATQGSDWTVQHAGNIGIQWLPNLNFASAHPAKYFGDLHPIEQIMKDKSTSQEMALFIKSITAKKGPSGRNEREFLQNKFTFDPKDGQYFNIFIQQLRVIAANPAKEDAVKDLLITLIFALGLNDPVHSLSARVENVLQIQTLNGIRMSAKPEVVMGKILEDTTLLNFLCSEGKKILMSSRAEGEAQVLAELITAILANYIRTGKVVPVVNMFTNGPFVRFVGVNPPESYVAALEQANLAGVTDRPIFTVYPPYDPNKPRTAQGFNCFEDSGRDGMVSTIAQLRHNIICSCPVMKQSKTANK